MRDTQVLAQRAIERANLVEIRSGMSTETSEVDQLFLAESKAKITWQNEGVEFKYTPKVCKHEGYSDINVIATVIKEDTATGRKFALHLFPNKLILN